MRKIVLLLPVFIIISCGTNIDRNAKKTIENSYTIHGKIDGRDTGWVVLGADDSTGHAPLILFDSAKISGSYFSLHGKLPNALMCKMIIRDIQGWPYTHYFVLDTGTTNAHLYNDSVANSVITGTPLQEQLNTFNKKLFNLEIAFSKNFSLNKKGIVSDDSLNTLQQAFNNDKQDLLLQQIEINPVAILSGFVSREILRDDPDIPTLQKFSDALGDADNYFAKHLRNVLAAKNVTGIGMQAPGFTITDNTSKTYTNDSFKGKYLLLDFWASWCVPCREENPNVVKAHKKYAGKGLQMVSISLDNDKKSWINAVKKDKLTWMQICDLKGANNKVSKDFGVLFIPMNFLIDKDGRIVAKNLTGKDLEKVLAEKLGNN